MTDVPPIKRIDLSGLDPAESTLAVAAALSREPTATRKVYAALCHRVWQIGVSGEAKDRTTVKRWISQLEMIATVIRRKGTDPVAAHRIDALAEILTLGLFPDEDL